MVTFPRNGGEATGTPAFSQDIGRQVLHAELGTAALQFERRSDNDRCRFTIAEFPQRWTGEIDFRNSSSQERKGRKIFSS